MIFIVFFLNNSFGLLYKIKLLLCNIIGKKLNFIFYKFVYFYVNFIF